jgi:hypothetical protein
MPVAVYSVKVSGCWGIDLYISQVIYLGHQKAPALGKQGSLNSELEELMNRTTTATATFSASGPTMSAPACLHRLLDNTSLRGKPAAKRAFCAWVAAFDGRLESMKDLPKSDQHTLIRRFRVWDRETFEEHISAWLRETCAVVYDVDGNSYNSRLLTKQEAQDIAAGWLA